MATWLGSFFPNSSFPLGTTAFTFCSPDGPACSTNAVDVSTSIEPHGSASLEESDVSSSAGKVDTAVSLVAVSTLLILWNLQ
jgi:hypothetical protein